MQRKTRTLLLALGLPGAVLVASAATAGAVLSAPGTTVFGMDVAWKTSSQITDAVEQRLADTTVTLQRDGTEVEVTGDEIGLRPASSDVGTEIRGDHPLWNVTEWNGPGAGIEVAVDSAKLARIAEDEFPDLKADPSNAEVVFNGSTYEVKDHSEGREIDTAELARLVEEDLAAPEPSGRIDVPARPVPAAFTTQDAQPSVDKLNDILTTAEITLDGEQILDIPPEQVADWLTVRVNDGELRVIADAGAIQTTLNALPGRVNQEATPSTVVTNAGGEHLHVVEEGSDGFRLTGLDEAGAAYTRQLQNLGGGSFAVTGEVVKHDVREVFRRAEVDKAAGVSRFYENGQLVKTIPMAIGKPGTETDAGEFEVYAQLQIQDMGDCGGDYGFGYCTPNVPWVTYFNGDEGFHGTYWHSNFGPGAQESHGCVNLTEEDAEWVYRFLQIGSPVSVT